MKPLKGVFAGLTTLDVIQQAEEFPEEGTKADALACILAAGGPASNAAVAYAHAYPSLSVYGLNAPGQAVLVSRIGDDVAGAAAREDLESCGVSLMPVSTDRPTTVSSVIVSPSGERTIVSPGDGGKAGSSMLSEVDGKMLDRAVKDASIVLLDGYELDIALPLAERAQAADIPVVLDLGRERDTSDDVIALSDIVIASSSYKDGDFDEAAEHMHDLRVEYFAMTCGPERVRYSACGFVGYAPVNAVDAVDTLAAGDFFHGAFAKAISGKELCLSSFTTSLEAAAAVAAASVMSFGSREWLSRV